MNIYLKDNVYLDLLYINILIPICIIEMCISVNVRRIADKIRNKNVYFHQVKWYHLLEENSYIIILLSIYI